MKIIDWLCNKLVTRTISTLKLEPSDILVLHHPKGLSGTNIKSFSDDIKRLGVKNKIITLEDGFRFSVIK